MVPASPTPGFLSQIAAFQLALRKLPWTNWEPSILASFGGGIERENAYHLAQWHRYLPDATIVFPRPRPTDGQYDGQIDELYRSAPVDADVLVRIDADVLPTAPLEPILDRVLEQSAIAGVIAHYRFPAPPELANHDAWLAFEERFLTEPLRFDYSYSLLAADVPEEERETPYYLNEGCIFFAREYFDRLAPLYLETRPQVAEMLEDPYFAGQVTLALAAAQIPLPSIALPFRYNFPNDPIAADRFPEEMENAAIIHYLRLEELDRQKIFRSRDAYESFLERPLNPANERFREAVRSLLGDAYPFDSGDGPASGGQRTAEDMPSAESEEGLVARFQETGGLEPLMKVKQSLVARLGVPGGWARYRELFGLPPDARIHYRTMRGQNDYARSRAAHYVETLAGGTPFTVGSIPVWGEGECPELSWRSRSTHVARIDDAFVRDQSEVIETRHYALLDFEAAELELFDREFEIDPALFSATHHSAWVIGGDRDPNCLRLEEAFTLLGTHLGAFGDFMMYYLPRYIWADLSGELPRVPILVTSKLPGTIREALRLLIPEEVELAAVDELQPVHVDRLWCAANLTYFPTREVMDERYSPLHQLPPPDAMRSVVQELKRRVAPHVRGDGPERVYLSRGPERWRAVVNADEIEAIAGEHGFVVVRPEELTFVEQVNLLASATQVIAPEGSALFLCAFAPPGVKICILNHTIDIVLNLYRLFVPDAELAIVTGPVEALDPAFEHRSSYRIDPEGFRGFLAEWL